MLQTSIRIYMFTPKADGQGEDMKLVALAPLHMRDEVAVEVSDRNISLKVAGVAKRFAYEIAEPLTVFSGDDFINLP